MTGVSRRTLIASGAAMAGALAASQVLPESDVDAATPEDNVTMPREAAADGRTGTVADVKHVVIVMQENRSLDHYFGTLGGVRGYGDQTPVRYPNGTTAFDQPDPTRSNGVLRPFRMYTSRYDAQEASDLDHSWETMHEAANGGAWNKWVPAKTAETMGYFARGDIPWQYALADAYTICDAYHASVQGPTTPNRLHMWTGTVDPQGSHGGPVKDNPPVYEPRYTWTTYPERLQNAGVDWQVYANTEVGYGDWLGDFGDNVLWLFHAYHDAETSSDPKVRQLSTRGSVVPWTPELKRGHSVAHVLGSFIADCRNNSLPTVSWVVAPRLYSEHPKARPVDGAAYVSGVLEALWANQELWESTVVLLNYDENDGFFDHAIPPMPKAGTAGEYIDGEPIGLGPRLPLTVVSPWSAGGWVNSQVFDHTSVLRFLEVVTGVPEPNISAWRRSVCGDLTSCFDFTSFDPTVPRLPDIDALVDAANTEKTLPKVPAPPDGPQTMPVPEDTTRKHRPLPYGPSAAFSIADGHTVTINLTNTGTAAISYAVFNAGKTPFAPVPVLVGHGQTQPYTFDTTAANRRYDLAIHGPNGFLHEYQGVAGKATATAQPGSGVLRVTMANPGPVPVVFHVTETIGGTQHTYNLLPRDVRSASLLTVDGWYDVTVAAGELNHRFAGRIEPAGV